MSEQPSRLTLLRFLERVQLQQLDQTRRWIAAEEQREADEAARRTPPPPPDWVIEMSLTGTPQTVHVGGCRMGGTQARTKPLSRDQALRALTEGIEACQFCRPDSELGVLD